MWIIKQLDEDMFFCGYDYEGTPQYTSHRKNPFIYKFGSERTAINWAFRNGLKRVECVKI